MYGSMPYMMPGMAIPASNAATLGSATKAGSSIFSKINLSSLLSNAQKTLGVVNQAIPLYYQVKPVFKNLKALGKIGKEFTKINENNNQNSNRNTQQRSVTNISSNNDRATSNITDSQNDYPTPTFYL
jgi:endonuclease/exonuclease/phosphatase (EEP) superfamily protein YafD